jgi:hypothetical protein
MRGVRPAQGLLIMWGTGRRHPLGNCNYLKYIDQFEFQLVIRLKAKLCAEALTSVVVVGAAQLEIQHWLLRAVAFTVSLLLHVSCACTTRKRMQLAVDNAILHSTAYNDTISATLYDNVQVYNSTYDVWSTA